MALLTMFAQDLSLGDKVASHGSVSYFVITPTSVTWSVVTTLVLSPSYGSPDQMQVTLSDQNGNPIGGGLWDRGSVVTVFVGNPNNLN